MVQSPCEIRGWKVGDLFEYIDEPRNAEIIRTLRNQLNASPNDLIVLELKKDDRTSIPFFKVYLNGTLQYNSFICNISRLQRFEVTLIANYESTEHIEQTRQTRDIMDITKGFCR